MYDDPVDGIRKECNDIRINGTKAALEGYPQVEISHSVKVCNFNDANKIKLVPGSKLEFYYPNPITKQQESFFRRPLQNNFLGKGTCIEESGFTKLNTDRASYYLKALLQGPSQNALSTSVPNGYCYAYAFYPVEIKYDYGLPACEVEVSV